MNKGNYHAQLVDPARNCRRASRSGAVGIYNGLVTARNAFKNAFAQIDVQLQRRYDLIPNLVETAKGYIKHERETLEAVIAARSAAMAGLAAAKASPGDPAAMAELAGAAGHADRGAGPAVRGGRGLSRPQGQPEHDAASEELTSTENKVAFARQAYNDSVMAYNNKREVFPSSIIAGMFDFAPAALLEIRPTAGAGARGAEGAVLIDA